MAELYFQDPREYLQFEFELRRARRPSYSMRAFARDLDVSHSSLHDFMKGRIGMSEDRIANLSSFFHWSELRREHFRDLIQARFEKDQGVRQACLMRIRTRLKQGKQGLTSDAFKFISEWYHLVILELCGLIDGADENRIAQELRLDLATSKRAVRRLIYLKLLARGARGLKPSVGNNHFGDLGSSQAVRLFHSQMLDLAQQTLEREPVEENDSHSLVYSVARSEIPKMNAEIRRALLNIVTRYAEKPNPDCIQGLTLQIFPIWPASDATPVQEKPV